MNALPKISTDELLKRYREKIPINEVTNEAKAKEVNMKINEFVKEIKDLISILKTFKKSLKAIVPIKEQEMAFYKNAIDSLIKYEEISNKKCGEEFSLFIFHGGKFMY